MGHLGTSLGFYYPQRITMKVSFDSKLTTSSNMWLMRNSLEGAQNSHALAIILNTATHSHHLSFCCGKLFMRRKSLLWLDCSISLAMHQRWLLSEDKYVGPISVTMKLVTSQPSSTRSSGIGSNPMSFLNF